MSVLVNIYYILLGIVLGLSLAAPPGPVNAIIATESTKSRLHGISVGLGATSADFTYFLVMFFFSAIIPNYVVNYFYIVGGLLLLYIAYSINKPRKNSTTPKGNYLTGYFMAISSPFNLSWWLTAGLFLFKNLSAYSLVGLFSGVLIWVLSFSTLIFRFGKRLDFKVINYISSAVLVLFGLFMLYKSLIIFI